MNCEVFDYWSTSLYMIENENHDETKQEALDYIYDSLETEYEIAPRAKGKGLRETSLNLFHKAQKNKLGHGLKPIYEQCMRGVSTAVCHKNKIQAEEITVEMLDSWAHVTNDGGYHDVHNHPNCSWCGIYCVQAGDTSSENLNGINRFHSPLNSMTIDGGSHYLAENSNDWEPKDGILIVFPSYLMHSALPYSGEIDRVVISFNTVTTFNTQQAFERSWE